MKTSMQVRHVDNGYYSKLWKVILRITLDDGSFYRLHSYATSSTLEDSEHMQKETIKELAFEDIDIEKYVNDDVYRHKYVRQLNEKTSKLLDMWEASSNSIFQTIGYNII